MNVNGELRKNSTYDILVTLKIVETGESNREQLTGKEVSNSRRTKNDTVHYDLTLDLDSVVQSSET